MVKIFCRRYSNMVKIILVIYIYCDGPAVIAKAYIFIYNDKSRHIHHRHNDIRQLL